MDDANTHSIPTDHHERMQRALLSLDGLSVGDSFGESAGRDGIPADWLKAREAVMV